MRILKYLFLLFLLSLVALTIFVATQKGDYTVERSKIINSPRPLVFNYVNDTKNWVAWNSWAVEDAGIKVTNSPNTIGNGSFYSWEGKEGSGNVQTISIKENDNIVQKMNYNGNDSDVYIHFKDTVGGTKVTWKTIGKMSFSYKILTAFNSNLKSVISIMFEKSLANLDKKLNYEVNTFSAKVNGLVNVQKSFYLAQTFTSEISKVDKNSGIVFPKIISYCKKNNISINGKPFIIHHTYDTINKLTKISICIPIRDSIANVAQNSISLNKIEAYQALKTTLTGDYIHKKKALVKAKEYFTANFLNANDTFSFIEIYTNGTIETKNPSKWITEIYIPVRPKVVYKKPLAIEPNIEEHPSEIITPIKVTPTKTITTKTIPTKVAPVSKPEKEIPSEF
ncbi:transcriptional regulator [Flavobacterium sp.]|uniref:transcriptional regulator n=1 Tax=Flavobacterium sp. TaxID=239 RepID=UPI00379DD15B